MSGPIAGHERGEVVLTIGGVVVRLDHGAAEKLGRSLMTQARVAQEWIHGEKARERAAAVVASFRLNHPDALEIQTVNHGVVLVPPGALQDDWPSGLSVRVGQRITLDFSELPSVPPQWLLDKHGRTAHLWRGGAYTACGSYKRETRRGEWSGDKRCAACAALEAK